MTGLTCMLLALSVQPPPPTETSGSADSRLEQGIRQYRDGLLADAVATIDAVLPALRQDGSQRSHLVQALTFKGAALVGMLEEDAAKESFKEVLLLEPSVRLSRTDFPDRVIRVFEAARSGKTNSVLERPNTAPKKAGIGAIGVAGIVAGIVATAGGVAVATGGNNSEQPSPTPTPTPDPATFVTPITSSGPGQIAFVNAVPPPGSTMTGCTCTSSRCAGDVCGCIGRFSMVFSLRSSGRLVNQTLKVQLHDSNGSILVRGLSTAFDLNPNEPFQVLPSLWFQFAADCREPLPRTVTKLIAIVGPDGVATETFAQEFNFRWVFER